MPRDPAFPTMSSISSIRRSRHRRTLGTTAGTQCANTAATSTAINCPLTTLHGVRLEGGAGSVGQFRHARLCAVDVDVAAANANPLQHHLQSGIYDAAPGKRLRLWSPDTRHHR